MCTVHRQYYLAERPIGQTISYEIHPYARRFFILSFAEGERIENEKLYIVYVTDCHKWWRAAMVATATVAIEGKTIIIRIIIMVPSGNIRYTECENGIKNEKKRKKKIWSSRMKTVNIHLDMCLSIGCAAHARISRLTRSLRKHIKPKPNTFRFGFRDFLSFFRSIFNILHAFVVPCVQP